VLVQVAAKVLTALRNLCARVWRELCRAATFAWERILAPIARTARAIGRQLLETIRALALRAVRFLLAKFQRLTRAWWRVLPAGLAIQTSIIFGRAILRSPPPAASAALGFFLASVSVGIIALVLVRDVFVRTFRWSPTANRQFVATDRSSEYFEPSSVDNLLLYVDLGAVAGIRWTITNAGNVCRLLLENSAAAFARAFRSCERQIWRACTFLHHKVLQPLLRQVRRVVLFIWNSPLLSSAASMGLLWLLWAHHSGTWRWVFVEKTLLLGAESLQHAYDLGREFVLVEGARAATLAYDWASAAAGVAGTVLSNTKQQLISAAEDGDIESPRLAWLTWLTIVIATKQRPEIRVKALLQPFIVLYLTAMAGGAQYLPHMMVGVLCWCAVPVREYERRERERVQGEWQQWQQQHQQHQQQATRHEERMVPRRAGRAAPALPTGEVPTQRFKSQTECSICLESLAARPDGSAAGAEQGGGVVQLPCGHAFHGACIGPWLQREARCPLCRQAARGIDRVLEVVF